MAKKNCDRFEEMSAALSALAGQDGAIDAAAAMLADAARRERMIHVFGVDARAADIEGELFYRAGGLANIDPIYDPAFSNAHGAYRSELCRPLDGLTPKILEYYELIEPGDPMILTSFDADSTAFAQAAAWSKEKGLKLVAVVSKAPEDAKTAALPDETICFGERFQTLCMTAVLDEMMDRAVKSSQSDAVWQGTFFPGTETNRALLDRWLWRVRHL